MWLEVDPVIADVLKDDTQVRVTVQVYDGWLPDGEEQLYEGRIDGVVIPEGGKTVSVRMEVQV